MPRTRKAAPRRRTRGEGTVYQKTRTWATRDGTKRSKTLWVAEVSEGFVPVDGRWRRKRPRFFGATATEARAARDRYLAEAGKDVPAEPDATTVKEYAKRFIENTSRHARAATAYSYERTLRLHVLPSIGKIRIAELGPESVKRLYDHLRGRVSPSMLARVHVTLRAMLNLAREERVIATSPLESIRKTAPRHKRARVEAMTEKQVKALLRAARGHRLEALFTVAVTAGLRQGELFALRWSDVDLARRALSVQRSAQEVSGDITFVEPKTALSRRRVALSTVAVEALKRRKTMAGKENHASDLVFPSDRGWVLRKSNFLRKDWDPIRKAAGVPDTRFHNLRHTAASLLLIEGVHPKVVSELLGHASVTLTLDTYSHLIPTMQAGAAAAIDRVLRGGGHGKRGR